MTPIAASGQLGEMPPIVCGVDDEYALPLCVMLESLATAYHFDVTDLRVIVLHGALREESRNIIRFHAERLAIPLEFRAITMPTSAYPVFGHISKAAYLRLEIPGAVPESPVVLYLDADILVLRELRELQRYPLGNAPLAAVRDAQFPIVGASDALPGWQNLGIPPDREYFNSGVMLLNLSECKHRRIFEEAYRFLLEHPDCIRYWDQDALNWAARDAWLRLPYRWNTHAVSPRIPISDFIYRGKPGIPISDLLAYEREAAILHYAGPFKPWQSDYPISRLRDTYQEYLKNVICHSAEMKGNKRNGAS